MKKGVFICIGVTSLVLSFWIAVEAQPTHTSLTWPRPSDASYPDTMVMGFRPSGQIISAHSDEKLREWDVAVGKGAKSIALSPLMLAGSFPLMPVISRDGRWGASQGGTPASYLHETLLKIGADYSKDVVVWDLNSGQLVALLNIHNSLADFYLDFSGDGRLLAVGGETMESHSDPTYQKLPATTPRGWVGVYEWKTGRLVWSKGIGVPVKGVSFADNGNLAVVGGSVVSDPVESRATDKGGVVEVWNPALDKRLMQKTLTAQATAVAFSPDARSVVVAQSFLGTNVWDTQTGVLEFSLKRSLSGRHGERFQGSPYIDTLKISGDSRYVAASGERGRGGVNVWRLSDGLFTGNFNTSIQSTRPEPYDDAFTLSVDGNSLAVASSSDHEITVYPLPR